jgi:hypothetical protein
MSILILESGYRFIKMLQKIRGESGGEINIQERNVDVIIGLFISFFFLIIPLSIAWFGYGIMISIHEILLIVLMPSITLFVKLPSIVTEILFNRVNEEVQNLQGRVSRNLKRKRKSIFGNSKNEEVVQKQNRYFPYVAKFIACIFSFSFMLLIFVLLLIQITNLSFENDCKLKFGNTSVWQGCKVKIPYCKRPFSPKCNCAFFEY